MIVPVRKKYKVVTEKNVSMKTRTFTTGPRFQTDAGSGSSASPRGLCLSASLGVEPPRVLRRLGGEFGMLSDTSTSGLGLGVTSVVGISGLSKPQPTVVSTIDTARAVERHNTAQDAPITAQDAIPEPIPPCGGR